MTTIRENIKILLLKESLTLIDLAKLLSLKYKKPITANSLSQKLRRNTMKYKEVEEILDCLDYNIDFVKRINS